MHPLGRKGFTLIELLVVISIIALLASIVLASLGQARDKARMVALISELRQVRDFLEDYRWQYGAYPLSKAPGQTWGAITVCLNASESVNWPPSFWPTEAVARSPFPNIAKYLFQGQGELSCFKYNQDTSNHYFLRFAVKYTGDSDLINLNRALSNIFKTEFEDLEAPCVWYGGNYAVCDDFLVSPY